MDFMTSLPYWGIILITILNAVLVSRMKITFDDEPKDDQPKTDQP
ncbi:MAG: hypothetical protein RJQ09_14470 [Cyclobacteriaceae bacterium]